MAHSARGSPSSRRQSRGRPQTGSLVACCAFLPLLLLGQVAAETRPEAALARSTGALSLAPPASLALAGLPAADARKRGDYDDYEYGGEDDDGDDDYDYYGTKQKKKKKKPAAAAAQPIVLNETSMFKFFSALVMRFVWGIASGQVHLLDALQPGRIMAKNTKQVT
ncbi:uncharacterized protein LOC113210936 [Frankliniella occidentalis]|uniref:Uncharacterized protein LOC113210936 n=1 Tax=Frankliniella occidentalis TaxID=133901 RepID=A0A6J1SUG5_FRAOC|nr:uncharacterized protein LOC113210936 [Frankliniella occidentalis]